MWVKSKEGSLYNLSNAENIVFIWGHTSIASSGRIVATFSDGREATLFESIHEAHLRSIFEELSSAVLNDQSLDLSRRAATPADHSAGSQARADQAGVTG